MRKLCCIEYRINVQRKLTKAFRYTCCNQNAFISRLDKAGILPADINRDIGHFNVFSVNELMQRSKEEPFLPYDQRTYYKISLIVGRNSAEYADKVIDIENKGMLFASPKIPYSWCAKDLNQNGYFCVFTKECNGT